MRWECCECGARFERPHRPRVCRECGTASLFVEAEEALEHDLQAESVFESWFQRGQ